MRSASVWECTFVGGDEVDGRGRRALEYLRRLTVLRVRATGAGLAAGLALVAHLGLALGLDRTGDPCVRLVSDHTLRDRTECQQIVPHVKQSRVLSKELTYKGRRRMTQWLDAVPLSLLIFTIYWAN
jgi:hypothetical protein